MQKKKIIQDTAIMQIFTYYNYNYFYIFYMLSDPNCFSNVKKLGIMLQCHKAQSKYSPSTQQNNLIK